MTYTAPNDWYRRCGGTATDLSPAFTALQSDDPARLSAALRQAFAFFRRHGDRRYSAQSLMRLLTFADAIDGGATTDMPSVVVAEVPFSYDEDTEVKSGGVVANAVLLPDGRMMLAVHQERRRVRLGAVTLRMVRDYLTSYPAIWVHRANYSGMAFCVSTGLMPWVINSNGAVQFCERYVGEESDAVQREEDYVVDELLAQQRRSNRDRSRPQVVEVEAPASLADMVRVQRATRSVDRGMATPAFRYDAVEADSDGEETTADGPWWPHVERNANV